MFFRRQSLIVTLAIFILAIESGCFKMDGQPPSHGFSGQGSSAVPSQEDLSQCGTDPATHQPVPTYNSDIQRIVQNNCVQCHGTAEAQARGVIALDQINVITGAGGNQSLAAITDPNPATRMPLGGPALSQSDVQLWEEWIKFLKPMDSSKCPNMANLPQCTLKASAGTVSAGQSVTLTAQVSSSVTQLFIDGNVIPLTKPSFTDNPIVTTTYAATVKDAKNIPATCTVTVQVTSSNPTATPTPSASPVPSPSPTPTPPTTTTTSSYPTIKANVINEMRCAWCHLTVEGGIDTTRYMTGYMQADSGGAIVTGNWWAATPNYNTGYSSADTNSNPNALLNPNGGNSVAATILAGFVFNAAGSAMSMPADTNGDGKPDFPTLNFAKILSGVNGKVSATTSTSMLVSSVDGTVTKGPVTVTNVYNGNVVLIGTQQNPVTVSGDVLIEGDVVIKGYYSGLGTIYSTGHIYIPGNLLAMNPPSFPYPSDSNQALVQAQQDIANGKDGLGLAAGNSITIGEFWVPEYGRDTNFLGGSTETQQGGYVNEMSPWDDYTLNTLNVFKWLPGGAATYANYYDTVTPCMVNGSPVIEAPIAATRTTGSFERIDASLYAAKAVTGEAAMTSYAIDGVVVTDYFQILSQARDCSSSQISKMHGQPMNASYLRFDHRFRTGKFPVFRFLLPSFPSP